MKILYFSHGFPSLNSRFIWNELDHFSQSGQVGYLSLNTREGTVPTGFVQKVIPFRENRFMKKARWLLWKYDYLCSFRNRLFRKELNAFLKDFRPDIIHCHFAYEGLAVLQNMERDIPLVLHFHGYDASQMLNKKSYIKALEKAFAKPNVHAIYVSENIEAKLARVGLKTARKKVIYCGIQTENFLLKPLVDNTGFYFVQVSNLLEKKGLEFTISAFARFVSSQPTPEKFKLLIAGAGPLLEPLEKLTKDLGMTTHVSFLGQIPKDQVITLLEKAHVFVHHSITAANGDQEGIPTAIMEAMAMGIPVLSTYHSGIPELVENGVHGYLVPERDVEAYAKKMEEITKWREYRLRKSVEKVSRQFSSSVHARELTDFYRSILSR